MLMPTSMMTSRCLHVDHVGGPARSSSLAGSRYRFHLHHLLRPWCLIGFDSITLVREQIPWHGGPMD